MIPTDSDGNEDQLNQLLDDRVDISRTSRAGVVRVLLRIPALAMIGCVRLYQRFLSPIFGRQCRFHPTCSSYFIGAVEHYGAIRGSWRGLLRICRCHPWHPGGYDPPVPDIQHDSEPGN